MPARNACDRDYPNAFAARYKEPKTYGHVTHFEHREVLVHIYPMWPINNRNVPYRIEQVVKNLTGDGTATSKDGVNVKKRPPFHITDTRTAEDIVVGREKSIVIDSIYELTQYKPKIKDTDYTGPAYAQPLLPDEMQAPGVLGRMMGIVPAAPPAQRIMACHWSDARVALVGYGGRIVFVLDTRPHTRERVEDADFFVIRADDRVKGIRAVAWRPYCLDTLTAGCEAGVALWENARRLRILMAPGHTNVTAVAWCSDGACLLSASASDGQVRLWDVASGSCTVVCPGAALATAHLSPELLAAGAPRASAFRLYHLDSGHSERWGQLCGPPAAMTWCRKKPILVVAPRGEAALHFLAVDEGRDAKLIHTEPTGLAEKGPGGTAISIAWDPTGERLAVAYEWDPNQSAPFQDAWDKDVNGRFAVALYGTSLQPAFSMWPIGYVLGGKGNGPPMTVDFRARPKGKSGAVLVTAWATGAVSFTHLLFKPSS